MCAGAMLLSRVGALVWGAPNARAGADGSWVALLPPEGSELRHEVPIAPPAPLSAPGGQPRRTTSSSWAAPLPPEGSEPRPVLAEGCSKEAPPEYAAGSWGPGRESLQRSGEASTASKGQPTARPHGTAGGSALECLAKAPPGHERARHDDDDAAGSIAGWPAASPGASPARAGGRDGSLRASPGLGLALCSLEASAAGSPLEAAGRDGVGAASASAAGERAQPRSSSARTRACGEGVSAPDEAGPGGSGRASGAQHSWRPHPSHPVIQVRLGRWGQGTDLCAGMRMHRMRMALDLLQSLGLTPRQRVCP